MKGVLIQYCCIDLKSYYASVECVDRDLDPLTTMERNGQIGGHRK